MQVGELQTSANDVIQTKAQSKRPSKRDLFWSKGFPFSLFVILRDGFILTHWLVRVSEWVGVVAWALSEKPSEPSDIPEFSRHVSPPGWPVKSITDQRVYSATFPSRFLVVFLFCWSFTLFLVPFLLKRIPQQIFFLRLPSFYNTLFWAH